MKVLKDIKLKHVIIYLLEGNILKIVVKEKSVIDVDDVKEIQKAKRALIGDQKHTVLFITPQWGSMTKEARDYSALPEVSANALGKAVVLNGLAIRIITNFFIKFNNPPVEHKVFENEKDALAWLKTLNGSGEATNS